jgi:hypothetical protein
MYIHTVLLLVEPWFLARVVHFRLDWVAKRSKVRHLLLLLLLWLFRDDDHDDAVQVEEGDAASFSWWPNVSTSETWYRHVPGQPVFVCCYCLLMMLLLLFDDDDDVDVVRVHVVNKRNKREKRNK